MKVTHKLEYSYRKEIFFCTYTDRTVGLKLKVMESIEKRFKKVLNDYGIPNSKISDETDYYFDLNLDVLDLMGLARKIKKEFLISIPDNEILRMERISDTLYFLKQRSQLMFSQN